MPLIDRISAYEANRLLDYSFGDGAWIQAHSDDPGEDGTSNLIVGAARVFVPAFSVAADKETHNVDAFVFESMPACVLGGFSAWDAEEDGNFKRGTQRKSGSPLEFDPLTVPEGASVTVPAEECVFDFHNKEFD